MNSFFPGQSDTRRESCAPPVRHKITAAVAQGDESSKMHASHFYPTLTVCNELYSFEVDFGRCKNVSLRRRIEIRAAAASRPSTTGKVEGGTNASFWGKSGGAAPGQMALGPRISAGTMFAEYSGSPKSVVTIANRVYRTMAFYDLITYFRP
jgi:hypothetical protein